MSSQPAVKKSDCMILRTQGEPTFSNYGANIVIFFESLIISGLKSAIFPNFVC